MQNKNVHNFAGGELRWEWIVTWFCTMKSVKLKIHKLGMIGESDEISLNQLMVFSGESGLGKSYLSIICHYLFAVLLDEERISSYFIRKGFIFSNMRGNFHGQGVAITIFKPEFERWLAEDAIVWLGYMIKNPEVKGSIEIKLPDSIPQVIEMKFEETMVGLSDNVETYLKLSLPGLSYTVRDSKSIYEESPFAFLFRYYLIQEIFGDFNSLSDSYVFPPSRGTVLTESVDPVTGMYVEFKKGLQKIHMAKPQKVEVPEGLRNLILRVLDGRVERRGGQYIYSTDGQEMPLSAAAASIRELASIEFLVENTEVGRSSIMIDEPEAHLHPLKQRLMADIVCCLLVGGAYVQITTHSDYFLRRLNELVMLFKLYDKCEDEGKKHYYDFCKENRIDPDLRISPDVISAYLLERRGEHQSAVVRQNMSNGIPFAAFHSAIDSSLWMKYNLERELEK